MPAVRPLPEDVASRIAAGEVIERPASVLKELVENALDAGATKIDVTTEGAGKKLIRVSDNGIGLTPEDCKIAFLRHTTSKISRLSDLDKLATFGFRGEALFSISAVSKTKLSSRSKNKKIAWSIQVNGGKVLKEHEAPPTQGTIIEVRDLFFNTPARAKFLKADPTERSHMARVVEEAALANPTIAFTYTSEGRTSADYPAQKGKGALRRRVADVLGKEYGQDLLHAENERNGLSVEAFLSPVESLKSSRGLQYIFVNKRPVANKTVSQALYRAYEPFRGKNRHPAAVIYLELPSSRVDVNVHPTKREVRFRPDNAVYQSVTQTLSKALLESKNIPTIPTGGSLYTPAPRHYAPAGTMGARSASQPSLINETSFPNTHATSLQTRLTGEDRVWFSTDLRYLGQIECSYLLFDAGGGLLIVDQHAAQEKVLFERYIGEIESGKLSTQKLILPLEIDMPASGIEKILARKKRLARIGFEVEPYGKTTLNILSAPSLFHTASDIKEMIHSLLDSLLAPAAAAMDVRYDATATIACKAAVKAHDRLSDQEATALMKDLRKCKDGTCCPHGRPTMLSMDRGELARKFGRPGPPPL